MACNAVGKLFEALKPLNFVAGLDSAHRIRSAAFDGYNNNNNNNNNNK